MILPKFYDNELLISAIYRYHNINGNISFQETLGEMFGDKKIFIHSHLPSSIDKIAHTMNLTSTGSKEIIYNHTLFNYYTAFTNSEMKEEVRQKMHMDKGKAYTTTGYHSIQLNRYYKYCPMCLEEQLHTHGDFYFDRAHQVSYMCTKHQIWLQDSSCALKSKVVDYSFIGNSKKDQHKLSAKTLSRALEVSKVIEWMVKSNNTPSLNEMKEYYFKKLRAKGLCCRANKSIKNKKLFQELIEFFGEEFINLAFETIVYEKVIGLIVQVVSPCYKKAQPLIHAIMIAFLKDVEDKEFELIKTKCYCLNRLSDHYMKEELTDVKVHYADNAHKWMCTCRCKCGFVYTTNVDSLNNSKGCMVGKVKAYGAQYEENLLKLRHKGIKGIARLTGINAGTIRAQLRYYDKFGAIPKKHISNTSNVKLEQIQGNKKKCSPKSYDKHWDKKEAMYYPGVEEIIEEELTKHDKPIWITKTMIAKRMNSISAIVYNLDKMPNLKKLILEKVETKEEYFIRKIKWAIKQAQIKGEDLKPWKIIEIGGFDDLNSKKLYELIEKQILRCNN